MSLAVHFQAFHRSEDGCICSFIHSWLNTRLRTLFSCVADSRIATLRIWQLEGLDRAKYLQYLEANLSSVWLKWRENSYHARKAKRFILLISSRALLSTDIQPSDPDREAKFPHRSTYYRKRKVIVIKQYTLTFPLPAIYCYANCHSLKRIYATFKKLVP